MAAALLLEGKVVAFPTETVYGLAVDCLNANALEALYNLKQRPKDKSFTLHLSNLNDAKSFSQDLSELFFKLARKFWPGPLTLVVKKKEGILPEFYKDTIAFRVPDHEIALKFIEKVGRPIAGTSANISGKEPAVSLLQVKSCFLEGVGFFLDGGESVLKKSSTVLDLSNEKLKILREGAITKKTLENFIGLSIF